LFHQGATAQIFLKVSRGVLPHAFSDLKPGNVRDFVAACLLPARVRMLLFFFFFFLFCWGFSRGNFLKVRPSAAQLMQAPFMLQKPEGKETTRF
jgi:hypothetical protein